MIQSMNMVASRRMKVNVHILNTLSLKSEINEAQLVFQKRQIYREQVQPHTGGKIPESAFETDRLLLNRLQKEGIAIPDGILLDQRNPKVSKFNMELKVIWFNYKRLFKDLQ